MTKYRALGLVVIALGVLGVTAWSLVDATSNVRLPRDVDVPSLKPLAATMADEQKRLKEGEQAMTQLALQAPAPKASAPLVALPVPGSAVAGSVQMPSRSMSLFLESIQDERDIVILDDQKVQVGSRLPEGGRVTKVEPYQVTVHERQGVQRLELPVERLQVGTLRWADGTPASVASQVYRNGPPPAAKVEAAK
jgi:hypothetical protein